MYLLSFYNTRSGFERDEEVRGRYTKGFYVPSTSIMKIFLNQHTCSIRVVRRYFNSVPISARTRTRVVRSCILSNMSTSHEASVHFVIPPPDIPKVPVIQSSINGPAFFPVRRIFCVGRNYANHVIEMGEDPRKEPPCFFMKPSYSIVSRSKSGSSTAIPPVPIEYPLATEDLHHEVELVVALGSSTMPDDGVRNVAIPDAASLIYGYAVGIDLTRRDLQFAAKKRGLPWCTSKGFDQSAPIGCIQSISNSEVHQQLHVPLTATTNRTDSDRNDDDDSTGASVMKMWLTVNGTERQVGFPVRQMIWSVSEIISALSQLYTLQAGDLIFTGTPEGVGPLLPGDHVVAGIDGLGELEFQMQARRE
jgi:fumarylpyruvate hydrolase